MSKDYYNILGVEKNAGQEEIKKAFYKKAHQYHPDKASGDEAKFKEVNEAYQVLSNQEKRAQYDRFGSDFANGAGAGGFNGFNGQGFNINMDDLGDLFGSFGDMFGFGGSGAGAQRQVRGGDLEMTVELEFLQAIFGADKRLKFKKNVRCKHCSGSGAEPGATIDTCATCQGRGRVTKVQRTMFGAMQMQVTCEACNGKGKKPSKQCRDCHGSGIVKEQVELDIKVPAGIDDGNTIKYQGQGEAGPENSPAGDLYVHFRVKSDKRWQRNDRDIKTRLEITYSEAVLGTKKEIETVDGFDTLKIPEGIASGKVLAMKGHGAPSLRGGNRGDHLVEVIVNIPTSVNRSQRKLLEELAKEGL